MGKSLGDKAVGGTLWTMAAQIVSLVVNSLAVILLARWLGPSAYGLLPMVNSLIAFLIIFTDFGISSSTARFISQRGVTDTPIGARILRDGFVIILIPSIVISCACLMSGDILARVFKDERIIPLASIAALLLFGRTALRYLVKAAQSFHRLQAAAQYSMFSETLIGGLALIAVLLGGHVREALWGRVIGALGSAVVISLLMWHTHIYRTRLSSESFIKRIITYGQPLLLTTVSFYIYTQSTVMFIAYFLDSTQVSYFNVPQALLQKIQMPAIALGSTLGPLFGSLEKAGDRRKIGQLYQLATKYVLALYFPIACGLILAAKPVIHLLLGKNYEQSVIVTQIYAPFLLFYALSGCVSPIFDYIGKAKFRAALIFSSSLVNVLLNILIIPRMGIQGAAWVSILTYCPAILVLFLYISRWSGVSLKTRWREFAGILAATALSMVCIWLLLPYAMAWIGFILMVGVSAGVYIGILQLLRVVTLREMKTVFIRRGRGLEQER